MICHKTKAKQTKNNWKLRPTFKNIGNISIFYEEKIISFYFILTEIVRIFGLDKFKEIRFKKKAIKNSTKKRTNAFSLYRWYIIHIIIIIMSCLQHGYPWPTLATSPYYSSPLAGLQDYILCPHIAAVCKFELVVLLLLGHMWGSIGVHHLWARPSSE